MDFTPLYPVNNAQAKRGISYPSFGLRLLRFQTGENKQMLHNERDWRCLFVHAQKSKKSKNFLCFLAYCAEMGKELTGMVSCQNTDLLRLWKAFSLKTAVCDDCMSNHKY